MLFGEALCRIVTINVMQSDFMSQNGAIYVVFLLRMLQEDCTKEKVAYVFCRLEEIF